MRFLKYFLLTSLAVITALLIFLGYYGLFAKVEIAEKTTAPMTLVYQVHHGDYKETGKIMQKVCNELNQQKSKMFAMFYDDPRHVETAKLRSIAGCIVSNASTNKYKTAEYPANKSVIASFPYKGKPSISLAILRVYPKLVTYLAEKKHPSSPIMEIYDFEERRIDYLSSISLPEDYFVGLME